ncbi:hypothetical protein GW17_00026178 [Ensete ventricosum]|nr:hypothetical protein GW17_00026178 [Ensete ventricosum]
MPSPLRAPCSRPPLRASSCKRVCPPAATAPAGCFPRERRRPPLRVAAPTSSADLPCGLALAATDRPLAGGLGRGWPALHGGWLPLLLAAFTAKT